MSLWFLSYVRVETNTFAGAVVCEGGDRNDVDGLVQAMRRAYDLGVTPGRDVDEQYQVSGKPLPPDLAPRFAPLVDRLLSRAELEQALPELDWTRLGNVSGLS